MTAFSIDLLGKLVGQTAKASEYSAFVRSRYRLVTERLAGIEDRPKVLVDAFAGADCCSSPGRNNRLAQSVELAGGKVIGADAIAGYDGRLNPEAVLDLDADVYIGTGVAQPPVEAGLILGGGVSAAEAQASLKSLLSHGIRRELTAVNTGKAYAVSHQISISALSVLTFECFAKWIHPELFADIDPAKTLAEINDRFMAVPVTGTFWTEL